MPDYPERFIKGIPHNNLINDDGIADQQLFAFIDRGEREDDWIEQSINWQDNEEVINFTLNQTRKGEIHYKAGVALVLTEELERLKRRPQYMGKIDYERNMTEDNPYHGNLLIIRTLSKPTKNAISAHLAILSEIVSRT